MDYDPFEPLRRSGLLDLERRLREACNIGAKVDQLTTLDSHIRAACDISATIEQFSKPFRDMNEQFTKTADQLGTTSEGAMREVIDDTKRLQNLFQQYDLKFQFPDVTPARFELPQIAPPVFKLPDLTWPRFELRHFTLPPATDPWHEETVDVEQEEPKAPARFVETDSDTVDTSPPKRRPARFIDADD